MPSRNTLKKRRLLRRVVSKQKRLVMHRRISGAFQAQRSLFPNQNGVSVWKPRCAAFFTALFYHFISTFFTESVFYQPCFAPSFEGMPYFCIFLQTADLLMPSCLPTAVTLRHCAYRSSRILFSKAAVISGSVSSLSISWM